jgi:hypothetical protein
MWTNLCASTWVKTQHSSDDNFLYHPEVGVRESVCVCVCVCMCVRVCECVCVFVCV